MIGIRTMLKAILISILSCFLMVAQADTGVKPLPAAKAFELSGHVTKARVLVLDWKMAPGYYLYRNKVSVVPLADNQVKMGDVALPAGLPRNDILHGDFQAYEHNLELNIPLESLQGRLAVKINYQGCSSAGFCYTPIKRTLMVDLATVKPSQELIANVVPTETYKPSLSDQRFASQLFNGRHYFLIVISFLLLGLLLAFTPCVLPMVPILSSIIVGSGRHLNSKKGFLLSLSYVWGMAIAYASAGMVVALVGSNVQLYFEKPLVIAVFAALFLVLSLSLFGLYEIRLPRALRQHLASRSHKQRGGNYISVFFMGAFSTLIVSPCVSAPLVGVLAYIGKSGDVVLGAVALLALGLGMGLPLLLLGASAGKLLPKTGAWMDAIKHFFGLMLLAVAIWMLGRILPGPAELFLWALLVIACALFVRQLKRSKRIWRHMHHGLGLILLSYGFILMAGALIGKTDPLYIFAKQSAVSAETKPAFAVIKNMAELDQELQLAKNNNKPVLLDFYADWCVSCVIMDRSVFTQPEIKKALEKFVLLRADVTQDNAFDQALLQRYQIVAPPTIVFITGQGAVLSNHSIVGEVDTKQFLADINQLDKKLQICESQASSC
jgi:thiol:disulfide interchange protein DsbD